MSKKELFWRDVERLEDALILEDANREAFELAEKEVAECEKNLLAKFCAEGGVVLTLEDDDDESRVNVLWQKVKGDEGKLETVDFVSFATNSPIGSELSKNLLANENAVEVLTRLRQLGVIATDYTLVCFRDGYYEFDGRDWDTIYDG